ncbi:MAG: alcohol dehydrogenase catalytic domain-containing protein [Vicinamibacterales bacterium]
MKAVVKLRPEAGAMALIDVAPPVRRLGEVLIRITAAGICGTDVAIWNWYESVVGQYAPIFPLIVGHEFAGVVVESESARVQVGSVVAVNPQIACGHCRYCGMGRPTLCDDRRLMGGRINGGWTELVSVPEWNVYPLPEGVDSAVAPLLEPLAVATHAVLERVPVRSGDVVAIIGAGPIGLLCAIVALAAGASKVMVTGVAADVSRFAIAEALGAIPVNVEAEDPIGAVNRLDPGGADVVYETSGVANTLEQAVAMTRRGGSVGLIGLCHAASVLKSTPVVIKELGLIGSRGYNQTTWSLTMAVLPKVARHLLRLVTHEVDLRDFERALQLVANREGGKVVLRP